MNLLSLIRQWPHAMNEASQLRLNEINALNRAIEAAGKPLRDYLEGLAAEGIEKLIACDSENLRGHVQLLKKLIDLPQSLQDEARLIMQELP